VCQKDIINIVSHPATIMSLTQNAIRLMHSMSGTSNEPSFCPTLQVLHLKKIGRIHDGRDRWTVVLSDGNNFIEAMLSTRLNHKVSSVEIARFALIKVNKFAVDTGPSGKKFPIILQCDSVLNPGSRLGNPEDIFKAQINPSKTKRDDFDTLIPPYDAGAKMDELERTTKRLKSTVDDHHTSLSAEIQKLEDEEKRIRDKLQNLEEKKQHYANEYGIPNVKYDDVIEINAGGKIIAARRCTLCQLKGTRLEALFCGRWEQKLQRDSNGRIFLDINSDLFQVIVDWLNLLSISPEDDPPQPPSVDEEHKYTLNHLKALFTGRRHSSFPGSPAKILPVVDRFGDDVNKAINERWTSLQELEAGATFLDNNFEDEEQFITSFATGCTSDIITLNVSGTIMATKRATLQVVDESMLAQQFDDTKWTEQGCDNVRVKEWTPDEVSNWTKSVKGMQEDVSNLFIENSINGTELLALDRDGLKDIGVKRVGTICLLLEEIGAMKEKVNKEAVTLIEHSPYCFGKILDFLRLKHLNSLELTGVPALPSVCEHKRGMFETVVRYYFPGDCSTLVLGS